MPRLDPEYSKFFRERLRRYGCANVAEELTLAEMVQDHQAEQFIDEQCAELNKLLEDEAAEMGNSVIEKI